MNPSTPTPDEPAASAAADAGAAEREPAAAAGAARTAGSLRIAVIGAGPVGLALALHAAGTLPHAEVTLFDARPLDRDVAGDPRTLALSLGSVQLLQRLGAWAGETAQPILQVHVSQQAPSLATWLPGRLAAEPELTIGALDEAVPMLGAVLSYGALVAPLQRAWLERAAADPRRLVTRFGTPVAAIKNVAGGAVEVDAGIADRFDLAVVAEGGVFQAERAPSVVVGDRKPALRRDYRQVAWVGQATFDGATPIGGTAYERFTRHGPAALLPLKDGRAGLVWCVPADDDPVQDLGDAQRAVVLNTIFHPRTPRIASLSPLKRFPLGLSAERTLVDGRTVRIGNAAQTLHPVAGQGLNLGLRDAFVLVRGLADRSDGDVGAVLARLEWQRAPDRWAMIATTDFLARTFTWQLPGAATARGLGIAALDAVKPLKSALARQMMFGSR
ncbi:FAD-dependent monooxygenase [Piscinibacter koreensis]|uniref:FAD-dependent monooxygenase n=1 Tax=Piscinibacter koreensis TaxID=2742824 RepID=A0A7Y6NK22_9BURK|nr:FAD-dependent monooxygenase [Schlegelella koreensis]NUZ04633.1 FAD-dependent monooxygenase [Schlegelella koreensis]